MSMPIRDHLLRIQRSFYQRLRQSARKSAGNPPRALRRYFLAYQRQLSDYQGISSVNELVQAIAGADILICGDYHTLAQAQRTVLGLLRHVVTNPGTPRPVLALEMFREQDAAALAEFLRTGDEARLVEQTSFATRWGFPWENYAPLLRFAREAGLGVVGLSAPGASRGKLRQRDRFAAGVLARLVAECPNRPLVALMGDLHLAPEHLPADLAAALNQSGHTRKLLVVHQNPERLYWRMAAREPVTRAGVLRVRPGEFAIMHTPPWIKLHSYIKWVEKGGEAAQEVSAWQPNDHTDEFQELVEWLQRILGVRGAAPSFELSAPRGQALRALGPGRAAFVRAVASTVGSHFVPSHRLVVLARPNVSAAATEAAVYLHCMLSGRERGFEVPRHDFYPAVWAEALGFLGSKIINPHRRCYHYADFLRAAPQDKLAREVVRHWRALDAKPGEQALGLVPRCLPAPGAVALYRVARCLGQALGDALHTALLSERISAEVLRGFFHDPFDRPRSARAGFWEWAHRLDLAKELSTDLARDRKTRRVARAR